MTHQLEVVVERKVRSDGFGCGLGRRLTPSTYGHDLVIRQRLQRWYVR
jgi:hypothetical protein